MTCGLCNQGIADDDTAFHLAGGCKAAEIALAVIEHDIGHGGPISKAIERIAENVIHRMRLLSVPRQ